MCFSNLASILALAIAGVKGAKASLLCPCVSQSGLNLALANAGEESDRQSAVLMSFSIWPWQMQVKRATDSLLGIPSQCFVADKAGVGTETRTSRPQYTA